MKYDKSKVKKICSFIFTRILIYSLIAVVTLLTIGYISMERMLLPGVKADKAGNMVLRSGNAELDVFYHPAPAGRPTVIYSHGNGETLSSVKMLLNNFIQQKYGIIAYDYAGYGASAGRAGVKQACMDIEAVYRFLTRDEKISPDKIVLFGYSVGSGPSCHLLQKNTPAALVLAAPFASAIEVMLPFPLPGNRFCNAEIVGKSKVPLLLMHGTNDEIVPFRNSEKLYRKAGGSKHFLVVKAAGHNDLLMKMGGGFWLELEKFLLKNGVIKANN